MQTAMKETWITTGQAAELEGISRQAAYKKISSGDWEAKKGRLSQGGGTGGTGYMVALSSLSALARRRWYEGQAAQEEVSCTTEEDKQSEEPESLRSPVNLAEVKAMVGEERFEELLQDAEQRARAVREYLSATGNYGERTWKAKRIAEDYGISDKTLYRWVKKYQELGVVGLMKNLPSLGAGTKRRAVVGEVERFARAEYLKPNQPKVSHVYEKVKKFCKKNGLKVPSRPTIYRVIDELKATEPDLVCLAREGEEEYMKRFAEKLVRKEPDFINQVWMGDHHRMDFFVMYQGKPVRPWLTAWMDVAGRTVTGWALSIQANGRTIGLALRHGIWYKQIQSWDAPFSPAMENAIDSLGWDEEELSWAGKEIPFHGIPLTLYIDNGEDYKAKVKKGVKHPDWEYSREVRTTCDILEIEPQFATKYAAWAKAHVERWFGTLTDQFARYIPGYCGNDNKKRPYLLDEKAMAERGQLLELDEAAFLLELYINVYHNAVHSSLGMTPAQKHASTPIAREGMPDLRTLDICLMDVEEAKVMASGIQRFGTKGKRRYYQDRALEEYVGQKVVIRYDPNRIGEILVFNKKTGSYICTATNAELMGWGTTKDDVSEFLKKRAGRKKELKKRLREYGETSLEAVTKDREAHGPRSVSGGEAQKKPDIPYITGMERAGKEHEASVMKKQPATMDKKKPAAGSRFDEFIRRAGSQN